MRSASVHIHPYTTAVPLVNRNGMPTTTGTQPPPSPRHTGKNTHLECWQCVAPFRPTVCGIARAVHIRRVHRDINCVYTFCVIQLCKDFPSLLYLRISTLYGTCWAIVWVRYASHRWATFSCIISDFFLFRSWLSPNLLFGISRIAVNG